MRSSPRSASADELAVLPDVGAFALLAPGEGWAVNGLSVFFTANDGAHWKTLQVPDLTGSDVVANLFASASVGANDLFLSYPTERVYGSCAHPTGAGASTSIYFIGSVARSTDRGRSWQLSTLPGCVLATSLSFPSAQTGFALAVGAGPTPSRSTLLTTSDGGRVWRRVSIVPFAGSIQFLSASAGWGLGRFSRPVAAEFGPSLYRTTDGGRSWRRVAICGTRSPPAATTLCGIPRFFGPRDGVIAVNTPAPDGWRLVIYYTANGGDTWTTSPQATVPAATPNASASRFCATSATSWIAAVGTRLYTTADQGRHWMTLAPRPGFRVSSITELAFASASDGWILTSPISNVPNAATVFEYTTNGGRTWEPLSGS
jgi:photosystem II stability/assembly factor-like uncharacterized protein